MIDDRIGLQLYDDPKVGGFSSAVGGSSIHGNDKDGDTTYYDEEAFSKSDQAYLDCGLERHLGKASGELMWRHSGGLRLKAKWDLQARPDTSSGRSGSTTEFRLAGHMFSRSARYDHGSIGVPLYVQAAPHGSHLYCHNCVHLGGKLVWLRASTNTSGEMESKNFSISQRARADSRPR